MDKPSKGKAPDNAIQNHCFPVFHGLAPVNPGEDEVCQLFRPSFDVDENSNCYRPSSLPSANPVPERGDDTGELQRKNYDAGVTAGQEDAHCLVQQEVRPGLERFAQIMNQFSVQLAAMTESSADCVLRLASGIVHKVLGESVSLEDEDLEPFCREIQVAMMDAYAIDLQMNAEDLNAMSAMVECAPDLTLNSDGVQLEGNGQIRQGTLQCPESDPVFSFDSIERALAQLLHREPSA